MAGQFAAGLIGRAVVARASANRAVIAGQSQHEVSSAFAVLATAHARAEPGVGFALALPRAILRESEQRASGLVARLGVETVERLALETHA